MSVIRKPELSVDDLHIIVCGLRAISDDAKVGARAAVLCEYIERIGSEWESINAEWWDSNGEMRQP